jgi:hypothetical protein
LPYFFFDYFDGQRLDEDDLGVELPDVETAHREAIQAAIEIWADALREPRNPSRDYFRIRDNNGNVLLELPFAELAEGIRPMRK